MTADQKSFCGLHFASQTLATILLNILVNSSADARDDEHNHIIHDLESPPTQDTNWTQHDGANAYKLFMITAVLLRKAGISEVFRVWCVICIPFAHQHHWQRCISREAIIILLGSTYVCEAPCTGRRLKQWQAPHHTELKSCPNRYAE